MRGFAHSLIVGAVLCVALAQPAPAADHREAVLVIDAAASAVILIPPLGSAQQLLWSGPPLVTPTDAILEPDGSLLIIDPGASALFRFVPAAGGGPPTAVDAGGQIDNCWLERLSATELLLSGPQGLIHVGPDPTMPGRIQTPLPTILVDPFDLTVAPDGSVLVADPGANALVSVDPEDWVGTPLSTGGFPCWIEVDAPAQQIITAGPQGVFLVDPGGGDPVPLSSGGLLSDPTAVAVDSHGDIFVADRGAPAFAAGVGGGLPSVVRVDPQTGEQTLMTSGGFLEGPEGLLVLPEPSGRWRFVSGLALVGILGLRSRNRSS